MRHPWIAPALLGLGRFQPRQQGCGARGPNVVLVNGLGISGDVVRAREILQEDGWGPASFRAVDRFILGLAQEEAVADGPLLGELAEARFEVRHMET